MEEIKKALQEIAKAIENNDTVQNVKITISLQKPNKAKSKDDK